MKNMEESTARSPKKFHHKTIVQAYHLLELLLQDAVNYLTSLILHQQSIHCPRGATTSQRV